MDLYWSLSLPAKIALAAFAASWLVQLIYYTLFYSRIAFSKQKKSAGNTPPVSVVICAKNELGNLREFLPSILEQSYPHYQVVVVNDCSWDESELYLEELSKKYKHLKVVTLHEQENYPHGKKFALAIGIKAAEHEWLLLTDADCKPAGPNWIRGMAKNFNNGASIVTGYGGYMKERGLVNKLVRFDTVFNAVQYLSYAMMKIPYMGVGRNLAYRRSLFFANKGFASHNHILSGDDDLFVNEVATGKITHAETASDSFTYSKPKTRFTDWIKQKRRHLSTGKYYRAGHKLLLGMFGISHLLFYISFIICIFLKLYTEVVVSAFVLRLILQLIIYGKAMKRLTETDLIWLAPLLDIVVSFINPALSFVSLISKNKTWK